MRIYLFLLMLLILIGVEAQTTVTTQVTKFEIEAPQLDTLKTIWIYLPSKYHKETGKKYPVIYMHDAQNLFDTSTSYVGEWKIDETLDSLQSQVIIVGIEHGGKKRIDELTPHIHPKYGGGQGDKYLDFIIQVLKPEIDTKYRTYSDRDNTCILGSSLGGLLSFYALLKHPEVFSKAGIFSPSFWFSDEIFTLVNTIPEKSYETISIYMVTGSEEDDKMISGHLEMTTLLDGKGMQPSYFRSIIRDGENHNETFWGSEFPKAIRWLFPEK